MEVDDERLPTDAYVLVHGAAWGGDALVVRHDHIQARALAESNACPARHVDVDEVVGRARVEECDCHDVPYRDE
jgi:hypothetical protein